MEDNKPKNPQAFPVINPNYDGNWNKEAHIKGMTLRDYFATKAMQSFIINAGYGSIDLKNIAQASYQAADAMLKQREEDQS